MNYNCPRWENKRQHILRRDKRMCQLSKRYGNRIDATTVHHIYPAEDYPEYEWCDWNLISLSGKMHNKCHDRTTRKLTEFGKVLMKRTTPHLRLENRGIRTPGRGNISNSETQKQKGAYTP